MEELDLLTPYSDLALEATEAMRGDAHVEIPGVAMTEESFEAAKVTRVKVLNQMGADSMGKPPGSYITIEATGLRQRDRKLQQAVGKVLVDELAALMNLGPTDQILVVGLGNWNATPDALGPRVTQKLLVTRHLGDYVSPDLRQGLRPVAALSPGVLGLTGIETAEIIKGVVEHVKPTLVIAIDALAAKNVERVGTTIQIADTGISPGGGIGNKRKGLNQEFLGVPVIAIGVPTVVYAGSIVNDAVDLILQHMQSEGKTFPGMFMSPDVRRGLIGDIVRPAIGALVVTPKEVDEMIDDMAVVISGSLNAVLHTSVSAQELMNY
ncbi:MAG TPA: GPR endopeptidase, partial [Symbiobacteriaceae bacterium]|nr:GPR endopeptidase [Symbiobacteriaceae bacterium]